jgi:hypothetical protein
MMLFLLMLIINLAMMKYWIPVTSKTKILLAGIASDELVFSNISGYVNFLFFKIPPPPPVQEHISFISEIDQVDVFIFDGLMYFPGLYRFCVSVIFLGSFLLRPLIMRPVSLVWARIIESEKPVFTVIFGGVAAFATAISEAAKHL